jgi:tight adherence protein B
MREFARRAPSLDVRFFVTAVLTQRESGGNLAEVLDNLAAVIRERFKVKRQIRVVTTHGRMTGWILAALPPILCAIMFAISPDTYRLLITDPLGVRMVLVGLGLQLVGTLAIRKIVDVEY